MNHPALKERIITGKVGKRITIDGQDCLNIGSHNYLGLLGDEEIQTQAIQSLRKYGVGSCGPRGFYGTIDVHLELEERLAKFMDREEAVVYSYAFSTIASAIPAYVKKGDIIFADEEVHFAIQKGLDASRAKTYYFKHNDVADLEDKMKQNEAIERKNPKKLVKKFLIVEGVYLNTGEMCPLPEIVALRRKYKCRLFLDETISFGTIGKTGRGVAEHFNVDVGYPENNFFEYEIMPSLKNLSFFATFRNLKSIYCHQVWNIPSDQLVVSVWVQHSLSSINDFPVWVTVFRHRYHRC